MGQNLTHGIYLPDEGERNCYDGLAGNWQLLDGAVGTVAEHTTQIAGKAPAVHTHTKSDITDLFNSANTWSKNNTYSADCIVYNSDNSGSVARLQLRNSKAEVLSTGNTSSNQSITFRDKNDFSFGYVYGTTQSNGVAIKIGANAKDSSDNTVNTELQILSFTNGNKAIFPATTNDYDLGISSYQWKSVQAQSYYYNGVAWGLDKSNTWSANQNLKNTAITDHKAVPSADTAIGWGIWSNDSKYWGGIRHSYFTTGISEVQITMSNWTTSGSQGFWHLDFGAAKDFSNVYFRPSANKTVDLGDSTHRWKTLNGINPGALSLPKTDASVTAINTSGFSFNGSSESVPDTVNLFSNGEALVDGWLCARLTEGAGHYIFLNSDDNTNKTGIIASCFSSGIVTSLVFGLSVYVPVKVGDKPTIRWAKPNGGHAQLVFYPCLGNV